MPIAHDKVGILGLIACLGSISSLKADVITVCPDGSCMHTSIQAAIDASNDGDTVLVRAGTYLENSLTPTGAITIEGEVDADQLPAVTLASEGGFLINFGPESQETVVKNLAMTTGTGVACSCWHSTPTLVNCTFIDNGPLNPSEFSFAGAIHNLNGAPVMIDCRFINNRGGQGGAFSTWESGPDPAHHPLFIRCTFRDNIAYSGGAIANLRSNPTLIDCVFENNTALVSGGAIYNDGFDEPDFWISRPVLENCTFRNNIAKINGGAIFNEGSSESTLTACMLTGNTAASGGAIMNNGASFSTLTNSTACANLPDQIAGTWHDQGGNLITHECDDPCREDLNGDDAVDGSDLSILLGNWNQSNSDADINQDGMIDGADLTILLGAWGACP